MAEFRWPLKGGAGWLNPGKQLQPQRMKRMRCSGRLSASRPADL